MRVLGAITTIVGGHAHEMPKASRIKVQLVLSPAARTRVDQQSLQSHLRALGIMVTATGNATVSGDISPRDFRKLWRVTPPTESGFTKSFTEPVLEVPTELADDIASISLVPRHLTINR